MTDNLPLEKQLEPLFAEFNESLRTLLAQSLDSGFGGFPDPHEEAQELRDEMVQRVANIAARALKDVNIASHGAMWQRIAGMAEDHLGAAPSAQELAQATVDVALRISRQDGK